MPTTQFPRVPSPPNNPDLRTLANYVSEVANLFAVLSKEMDYLLNGSLDANNIRANSITTDLLEAGSVTADKIQVDELSAISADLGTITAGVVNAITMNSSEINGTNIYGSYIATANGSYPRTEMSVSGNVFGAYLDADNSITIEPDYAGSPSLNFTQAGNLRGRVNTLLGYLEIFGDPAIAITSSSTIDVTGQMRFDDFTDVYDVSGTQSLQNYIDDINNDIATINAALGSKATAGASTGSGGGVFLNGGIPIGTNLATSTGGVVTWGGISVPSHSHTQT